jgi:hypothetical protein
LVRGAVVRYHQLVVTRKYPLDPLRRVREENVDRKVRALSDSLRHVASARDEAERSERRLRELEAALAATASKEEQRLTRGELTAADLARGAAWSLGSAIECAEKTRAVEQARARQVAAEGGATERQRELAEAKASAEVVAKHHEGWQRARAAESIARDEEDAEQAHTNLFGRRGAR